MNGESFRGLLLRHRGRSRLTQRQLAARVGAHRRTLQDWEAGVNHPNAELLRSLLQALLDAGGLNVGHEMAEAEELWAAVVREAPRMQMLFDAVWWAAVLGGQAELAARELQPDQAPLVVETSASAAQHSVDWGEAPDVLGFVGRAQELATLRTWVVDEHCRLAVVLGMGGIGKTTLAARLAEDAAPLVERLYWRSGRDALPIHEFLADAIGFLSDQQVLPPEGEGAQIATLIQLLRERPSLLVLDNFETFLEPGQREARYREGYNGYGRLLTTIGEGRHQSCLVVTSREAPPELAMLGGGAARTLELGGLGVPEAQALLADKQLAGSTEDWAALIDRFGGNGLALKVVGESIRQVFGGQLGAFLDEAGAATAFGGIRRLLDEQIARSSALEQHVLRILALAREPVALTALIAELGAEVTSGAVVEAVEALRHRSLVERAETPDAAAFTLQSVVLEYVTDRLVEELSLEISSGRTKLLVHLPLMRAQAKEYIRETQERLIGQPILQQLQERDRADGTEKQLIGLLGTWRRVPSNKQGYGPGNIVNLLRLMRGNLRRLDLSGLVIRQAYLAEVDAQDASLIEAHLADTVLAEAFDFPCAVALSGDGALLAAGTSTGQVWLWRVADRTPLWAVRAHIGGVSRLAISTHAQLLASVGEDGLVAVWSLAGVGDRQDSRLGTHVASSGRLLALLRGHTGAVWSAALSGDGALLASGGADGTVRLWSLAGAAHWRDAPPAMQETGSGRPLAILPAHTGGVWGVALSASGELLATGGADGRVRLWSLAGLRDRRGAQQSDNAQALTTLEAHPGGAWGVALSANGDLLATGGADGRVRLWSLSREGDGREVEVEVQVASTVSPLATLEGHTSGVWRVALSSDGLLLISAGADGTVRLWDPGTGRPLAILQGHSRADAKPAGAVWGLALSADGRLLASAGAEGALRLWEASTGRPLAILQGRTGAVWGVALSADGEVLASGGAEGAVRLWSLTGVTEGGALGKQEASIWRPLTNLRAHTGVVRSVALSADGHLVASGGEDGIVRLWSVAGTGAQRDDRLGMQEFGSGPPLAEFRGHTGVVRSVALSRDGRRLASGSDDSTVRLWDSGNGCALATLQGHTGVVWSVALSADGQLVASSGEDGTVRLWGTTSGRALATFHDHADGISSVALSSDGHLLASGGGGGTIQVWDTISRQPVAFLQGQAGAVGGLALSADGHLLASGGEDGTVRLYSLVGLSHSADGMFATRETSTRQPLSTLQGHAGAVWGIALSTDGHLLASGSLDGTVKLWETSSGSCLRTFRTERNYERLDITGLSGITEAQRAALLALGAVEQHAPVGTTPIAR